MFEVSIFCEFSSAHNLRGYKGKCEALHGHNWKVEVVVGSRKLDKLGMVVDFKILKEDLKGVLSLLDHKVLNALPFFEKVNPTSEEIARFIFRQMKKKDKARTRQIRWVKVWETATSCATYRES